MEHTNNDQANYILTIASSARMLAEFGQKAGFKPLVVDLMGDQDTSAFAEEVYQISSLAQENLLPAVAKLLNLYPVSKTVYGSGFEQHIDSLTALDSLVTIVGNEPCVFKRLADKPAFFSLLSSLQIPYPPVSFSLPEDDKAWLLKPMQGQGGVGIKRYRPGDIVEPSVYWQKYQDGIPHSVLFLADGNQCQLIGFNRQWTTSLNHRREFVFSGIINSTDLSSGTKKQLCCWIKKLVCELSLKGLNSLDFVQYGSTSFVLEINPRPPASMQLYDKDLFVRHIKACEGVLIDFRPVHEGFTAYQIVFAQQHISIPHGFDWPDNVLDIPLPNTIIRSGQPICSIIKHGNEPTQVLKHLQIQQEHLTNQLKKNSKLWNIPPALIN